MATERLTRSDIEAIIEIVKSAEDIEHFSLVYEGMEIRISRRSERDASAAQQEEIRISQGAAVPAGAVAEAIEAKPAIAAANTAQTNPAEKPAARENAIVVKAPMVGTFYRSPAPGEQPFVEVGQEITPDTVLCIIEVMKLMNSISAGAAGTVTEILVGNAEPVEFGQALIVIEPKA